MTVIMIQIVKLIPVTHPTEAVLNDIQLEDD